jgi:MFS superfamily sulfate permease-like transporter
MLAGIGVLIFAGQLHVTVDDVPKGSSLDNLLSISAAIWKGVVPFDGSPHPRAAAIGLLTVAVIVAWNATAIRARRLRVLPAPPIAVCAATLVANLLGLQVSYVSVPENLLDGANVASLAGVTRLLDPSILAVALAVALVASAETLLCATAIDRLHNGPRTDYDRELLAQGIGNSLCGLVGALPMTGVTVRSSANVEAGARTRLSAVLHGLWLLSLVAAMPFVLRLIPVSSLAAILVFTGYKLARQDVRSLARGGRSEVAIFFATTAGVVVLDLLTGVLIGLGLALIKLIWP